MFSRTKSRSQLTSAFSRTNTPTPPPSSLSSLANTSAATATATATVTATANASTSPQPTTPVGNSFSQPSTNTFNHSQTSNANNYSITGNSLRHAMTKNILKNVESHIRLMSHLENTSVTSSYNAVRLRRPVYDKNNCSISENNASNNSNNTHLHNANHTNNTEATAPLSQMSQTTSNTQNGYNKSDDATCASEQSQNANRTNNTSQSSWTEPFTATRIHRGTPTSSFYESVVAPCVANSIAGQSYLFLITGPVESGRSQTLYGSPHHHESGIIEMTAADLLTRMKSSTNTNDKSENFEESSANNITSTQRSEKNGPISHAEQANSPAIVEDPVHSMKTAYSSAGKLTVTYGAFTTRGDHITDTVTGKPVKLVEFPPPLCTVALPCMRLLDGDPARTVIVPERKYVDTSCIIQFQIYTTVDSSGRRSLATLTFVDVAAFKLPLCKDVLHLIDTVKRVTGVYSSSSSSSSFFSLSSSSSSAIGSLTKTNNANVNNAKSTVPTPVEPNSSYNTNSNNAMEKSKSANESKEAEESYDPHFKDYKLTTILESALVGYVTLVSISTISGRIDLHDSACKTLEFASLITRIHQVLTLTHIQAPKWLFEAAQKLELLRLEREEMVQAAYERGVSDYYQTFIKWFTEYRLSVHARLSSLIDETATVRSGIVQEMHKQLRALQDGIANEEQECVNAEMEAYRVHQVATETFNAVKRLDEKIATIEQQISQTDLQNGHQISEMRFEIATLEAQTAAREQELQLLEKNWKIYEHRKNEVHNVVNKAATELNGYHDRYKCARDLEALSRKRVKLESDLRLASTAAQKHTDDLRVDRERREKISRLMLLQQRVESLKGATAQIRSSYVIDTNVSESVFTATTFT